MNTELPFLANYGKGIFCMTKGISHVAYLSSYFLCDYGTSISIDKNETVIRLKLFYQSPNTGLFWTIYLI